MAKIILDTSCTHDYDGECTHALVDLDRDTAKKLLHHMDAFARMKKRDGELRALKRWDYSVKYFPLHEELEERGWSPGAGDVVLLADGDLESLKDPLTEDHFQRTECDLVVITEDQVFWTCRPKHTDVEIETAALERRHLAELAAPLEPDHECECPSRNPGIFGWDDDFDGTQGLDVFVPIMDTVPALQTWAAVERCDSCSRFWSDQEAAEHYFDEVIETRDAEGFHHVFINPSSRKKED